MSRTVRRLDRNRSFGSTLPPIGRQAFTQDHLNFDMQGFCVEDGPPPTAEELKRLAGENKGAPKGALLVSGGKEPDQPPPPPPPDALELIPRTAMQWQTMKFPLLRQALLEQKSYKAPNQVAALRYLDSLSLIIKE